MTSAMASLDSSMPPSTDCSAARSCGGCRSKVTAGWPDCRAWPSLVNHRHAVPPPTRSLIAVRRAERLARVELPTDPARCGHVFCLPAGTDSARITRPGVGTAAFEAAPTRAHPPTVSIKSRLPLGTGSSHVLIGAAVRHARAAAALQHAKPTCAQPGDRVWTEFARHAERHPAQDCGQRGENSDSSHICAGQTG